MLLGILLTIHILVCIALIGVVLLQRSEGGALGMGGGPTGFMSARGAGDLLTRTTWILFSVFLVLSIALTMLAGRERAGSSVTDRLTINSLDAGQLNQPPAPAAPATTATTAPEPLTAPTPTIRTPGLDPLAPATPDATTPAAPVQ
jgi:preprotein translocase subunit SecG